MVNRVQKAAREDILHIMLSKTRKFAVRMSGEKGYSNNSLVRSPKPTPSEASKSYKLASALCAVFFFLAIALPKKELVWFLSSRFV